MSLGEIEEYYIKYYKKDGEGIDPITGGKTDFISLKRGYKRYEKNNPQKLATNTVEHYLLKGLSLEEAQERVNYERYLKYLQDKEVNTIDMLIPFTIELTPSDYLKFNERKEILDNLGFKIEEFGTSPKKV